MPTDLRSRWNHNTHYHHLALQAVVPGAKTALDVGTGDGLLAADLRELVPQVTAIDLDPAVLDRARATRADVDWVVGDVMSTPLPEGRFDVVTSIATVHHLPDLSAGFTRLIASAVLPGMRWRRLPLFRYAVVWRKPA